MTMTENPYRPTMTAEQAPSWYDDDRRSRIGTFWISKQLVSGEISSTRFLSETGAFDVSSARDGIVVDWSDVPETLAVFGGMAVPR